MLGRTILERKELGVFERTFKKLFMKEGRRGNLIFNSHRQTKGILFGVNKRIAFIAFHIIRTRTSLSACPSTSALSLKLADLVSPAPTLEGFHLPEIYCSSAGPRRGRSFTGL